MPPQSGPLQSSMLCMSSQTSVPPQWCHQSARWQPWLESIHAKPRLWDGGPRAGVGGAGGGRQDSRQSGSQTPRRPGWWPEEELFTATRQLVAGPPSPTLAGTPHVEPNGARVDMWGKRVGAATPSRPESHPWAHGWPLLSLSFEKSLSFCSPWSLPWLEAGMGVSWSCTSSDRFLVGSKTSAEKEGKGLGHPGFLFLKNMMPYLYTGVHSGTVHSGTIHSGQEREATQVSING